VKKIKTVVPFGVLIASLVFLVLGLIARPLIANLTTPEQLASNVLLNAIPFILIFISILLVYVTIIIIVGNLLNNKISERIYRIIETILIAGIVVGVLSMFQPWSLQVYKYGFVVLLISVLGYIIWSHTTPKREGQAEEAIETPFIEPEQSQSQS
jgi:hypothetical protein